MTIIQTWILWGVTLWGAGFSGVWLEGVRYEHEEGGRLRWSLESKRLLLPANWAKWVRQGAIRLLPLRRKRGRALPSTKSRRPLSQGRLGQALAGKKKGQSGKRSCPRQKATRQGRPSAALERRGPPRRSSKQSPSQPRKRSPPLPRRRRPLLRSLPRRSALRRPKRPFFRRRPIYIRSPQVVAEADRRRVIFSGGVTVRQGSLRLRCPRLVALYNRRGEILRVLASGGVRLRQTGWRASAQRAVLDQQKGLLTLTGKPRLQRGRSSLQSRRVVYNLRTHRLTLEQAKGTFYPAEIKDGAQRHPPHKGRPPPRRRSRRRLR